MPRLSAGKGAGEGAAGAGAGCGGLQCARWTREGSKTLREKRALRRGGRGLVTKGTPTSGVFAGWGIFQGCCLGGSEGAVGEVRHAACLGKDTFPSPLGTRAYPGLARGLFCASET